MATHEEHVGVFRQVRWVAPTRDFVIGILDDESVVKGPAEPGELIPNVAYRFYGKWQPGNGKYGPAFAFVCAVKDLPHSREAIIQYLHRALNKAQSGLGLKAFNRLYDLYQSDTIRMLRMEPAKVAEALNHDLDKVHIAARILDADRKYEDCKIELTDLFAGKGFPKTAIKDCVDRWGAKAAAMIRRDAFLMITNRIKGAGFSRCDNLYLELGGDASKIKRQVLAAWHGLKSDGNGNTWVTAETAADHIRAKVTSTNIQPAKALKIGRRAGWLSVHRDTQNTWVSIREWATSEADIARLASRFLQSPPNWPKISNVQISPHQRERIGLSMLGRIGILAGTPGTGKTFTAAALIRELVDWFGHGKIAVCAPTGKAAVRVTENLDRYGLQLKACTIHRLLMPGDIGYGTGNWNFVCNEKNPLEVDWIIVDEVSMVDSDLLASLLRAAKPTAHILLIGDPYQLPPVGHGAPLRDLIAAGIPYGELTEIRRNSGQIVEACQAIKVGKPFKALNANDKFDDLTGKNLKLLSWRHFSKEKKEQGDWIIDEIEYFFKAIIEQAKRNPIDDLQLLVPLNEKSDLARKKINPIIQRILNPNGKQLEGNPFRVGDKIVCLSNDQYPSESGQKIPVMNGELGKVQEVDPAWAELVFQDTGDGDRVLRIPVKSEWASQFDLAYAITCHKSQGSDWPIVIVVIDDAAWRVASREWFYTAISRAKERCLLIGSQNTLGRQCQRQVLPDRKTFLVEKLKESMPAVVAPSLPDANDSPPVESTREARFWSKVDKTDGCWNWTASLHDKGYGKFSAGKRGESPLFAHRFSYELHKGDIPDGQVVMHTCDNPKCVNPEHLVLGTYKDNTHDMMGKGRGWWQTDEREQPQERVAAAVGLI